MVKDSVLQSWRSLDEVILTLKEKDLWELIEFEKAHLRRRLFLRRLFGRANRLRSERELTACLKGAK